MEEAAASFKTEIFSMSCGFMELISPSMPSINTNGPPSDPSPIVPVPRILISIFLSSVPLVVEICKPGTIPWRAWTAFWTGRDSNASALTMPTDPVRFTFFCVPNPTTTTSSSFCVSSSSVIFRIVCPVNLTSCVTNPMYDICMISPFFRLSNVNCPFISVMMPFVVPFTTTEAPATGPKLSSTIPVIFPLCWEKSTFGCPGVIPAWLATG